MLTGTYSIYLKLFRGKAIEVEKMKEQLDSANISFVIVPVFPY